MIMNPWLVSVIPYAFLFDLGISVQLWAIIPVLVLIPLLLKKILLQWIMHGLSMITGNMFLC